MGKIAILIDDMFEESEYSQPVDAFKKHGHEVITIGLKLKQVVGKHQKLSINIDRSIEDVKEDQFEALFIPGGYSPDRLRSSEKILIFVKEFMKKEKPIFVICHGAQVLISANIIQNRNITGFRSIKQDLINAKANYLDQKVVVDKNLVSSREPSDLPYFIDACLKMLEKN